MQERQQTQFYDKLLRCLNKTFYTNLKTQQLYLDLSRNTRKLRFKSIKNIYTTLTEGKADEVIFHKDKPNMFAFQAHNQLKIQRTCWRLIQKLITKIAYFLTNQRGLKDLGPTMLKAVGYTRKATDKLNTKASFVHFFSEVIDLLIEENNLLEKKIYNILIQRGYIYSADEFYRLSRFENIEDYTYTLTKRSDTENLSEIAQKDTVAKSVPHQSSMAKSGSRRGTFSAKKLFRNRTSMFYHFSESNRLSEDEDNRNEVQGSKLEVEIENISEKESSSSSQEESSQECIEMTNKLNHNIHEQVDKVISQLVHHPKYQAFLDSIKEEPQAPKSPPKPPKEKEPVIKQIIKNIRLKNFKANQQLLEINQDSHKENETEARQSEPKLKQSLKRSDKRAQRSPQKQRTSIATAISKRLKENWFKSSGLYDVQELVINNLTKISRNDPGEEPNLQEKQSMNSLLRKKKRLQTQNIEFMPKPILHQQQHRKSSNLHFFNNAFVFNTGFRKDNIYNHHRTNTYGPEVNHASHASVSSLNSHESGFTAKDADLLSQRRQSKESLLNHPHKDYQFSKFARNSKLNLKKKAYGGKKGFNTAFLELAARKYNRYSTEEHYLPLGSNLEQLINLHAFVSESPRGPQKIQEKAKLKGPGHSSGDRGSNEAAFMYNKRFQIFDRRKNRIL